MSNLVLFKEKEIVLAEPEVEKYTALMNKIEGVVSDFEEDADEWKPTQLKMRQGTSGGDSQVPSNADIGDFYYKGLKVEKPFNFLVIYAYPTRARFVDGEDVVPSCAAEKVDRKGKGPNDKSVSIYGDKCAECPFDDQPFRHGKPTNCNTQMNVVMLSEDLSDIFVYRFAKTSWSTGTSLVDMAKASPRAPWGRFFSMDSRMEKAAKKGAGMYGVVSVSAVDPVAKPVPDHMFAFAEYVSQQVKARREVQREIVLQRASDAAAVLEGSATDSRVEDAEFSEGYEDSM